MYTPLQVHAPLSFPKSLATPEEHARSAVASRWPYVTLDTYGVCCNRPTTRRPSMSYSSTQPLFLPHIRLVPLGEKDIELMYVTGESCGRSSKRSSPQLKPVDVHRACHGSCPSLPPGCVGGDTFTRVNEIPYIAIWGSQHRGDAHGLAGFRHCYAGASEARGSGRLPR